MNGRGVGAVVAVVCALIFASCGSPISGTSTTAAETETTATPSSESSAASGCLSPAEVEHEVNAIASGIEGSHGEVEAKQDAIRKVRERAC
jgi:hypothetical protein